jgi:chromosome segregation ATPase
MQSRSLRFSVFLLTVLVALSVCFVDAGAQRRRKRRVRRAPRPVVTNPAIAPPGAEQAPANGDDKIISTAEENPGEGEQSAETKNSRGRKPLSDQERMQETITTLSNQVTTLTEKLNQMQEDQRSLVDMERLTRAEQRAESMRAQLLDVQAKQADLEARLEQIDYALKPENIERFAANFGTTRPEEAREARRLQLESDRSRTQDQLNQLINSRARLEAAIATADHEVDVLRERLDKANSLRDQNSTTTTIEPNAPPPKNPYPPQ